MFSVIIPLYNKSNYIEKCLQSVTNQTFQDFEVIVVNDGSTDEGAAKVEQMLLDLLKLEPGYRNVEPKIKLINQLNYGVSTARNYGVKASKHNYIAFLDADDWWDPHFLEEIKTLIENFPNAGLYGSNFYYVKNGKCRTDTKGLKQGFVSGYIDYFKVYGSKFSVPINCSFVVVPRNIFILTGGFNPVLKFSEDFDLWVRIALRYKVAYVNKPLAYSNQDVPTNIRALGSDKLWVKEEHFIFNMDYLKDEEDGNPDLHGLLDGMRVRSLIGYYLSGKYQKEVNSIIESVDFSRQPFRFRFIYTWPKPFVRFYMDFKKYGSLAKQNLIRKHIQFTFTIW